MRDASVLARESRYSQGLYTVAVLTGALAFRFPYTYPGTGQRPGFGEALHAAFALVFSDTVLPFPDQWYLQVLFSLSPLWGWLPRPTM